MSDARPARRAIDGVLLLDKPAGITSHTAMQKARGLFNAAKAGHTGTLDPMATGLLPVCLGEATKFSHLLLDADKTYLASIRLDVTTETGDLEGQVTGRFAVVVQRSEIEAVLPAFTGEILQTPPMYSAIKHQGQPLYKLARAGRELPRAPRKVSIRSLQIVGFVGSELTIRVCCSKGTYVRVLAEDIGRRLGCGGSLSALRREAVGAFNLQSGTSTLERLELLSMSARESLLLPVDALVAALPRVDLAAAEARRLGQGQAVYCPAISVTGGLARVYGPGQEFLGVGEMAEPGRLVPKRLTVRN